MFGLFRWEGNGTLYSVVLWPLVRISGLARGAAVAGGAGRRGGRGGHVLGGPRAHDTPRSPSSGGLLLAVSPMALRYSQFARAFSFVLLFSALSVALLARHLRTVCAPLLGYALALALAAYSNSLSPILLVPAHALLVAPAGRAALRRLAVAVAGAAALAAR